MNKKARIEDKLLIEGNNIILLLLNGIGAFEVNEGQKLVCGNKKTIIDTIPMESGRKDFTSKKVSVGVKDNIFEIGDIVELV